jgi:hypothetical protein
VAGIGLLLGPSGVVTMEFPHLQRLIEGNQFDTIYHEHFSYFSFIVAREVFDWHGMTIFDVEELRSHGGSLRIFARHSANGAVPVQARVHDLTRRETELGYGSMEVYDEFARNVRSTKRKILQFLIEKKEKGNTIVGCGAPGKGNTLLNYCGIREDFLEYTVDISPHKQGTFTPGTHIPIYSPERLKQARPDYVFILPWNLTEEIVESNQYIREWGGQFVVPIPDVRVI